MEFPQAGRLSAKKFLEYFLSKQTLPTSIDDPSLVKPNWATISLDEAEAECLDISRTVLSMRCVHRVFVIDFYGFSNV